MADSTAELAVVPAGVSPCGRLRGDDSITFLVLD
jgi:hypothetical protein